MHSLSYADNIVILAKKEEYMRAICRKWEKYLDEKELIYNTNKSNIRERERKEKENHMEMEGAINRNSKGICVSGISSTEKWKYK